MELADCGSEVMKRERNAGQMSKHFHLNTTESPAISSAYETQVTCSVVTAGSLKS